MNTNNINDSTTAPSSSSGGGGGKHIIIKARPRITASGNKISSDDDEQPILMEAKLRELIISINQLIKSNQALDEALMDDNDDDLLAALRENDYLIHRRVIDATSIAKKLNNHGVHISLSDKILQYRGSIVLKKMEMEEKKKDRSNKKGDDGLYL